MFLKLANMIKKSMTWLLLQLRTCLRISCNGHRRVIEAENDRFLIIAGAIKCFAFVIIARLLDKAEWQNANIYRMVPQKRGTGTDGSPREIRLLDFFKFEYLKDRLTVWGDFLYDDIIP